MKKCLNCEKEIPENRKKYCSERCGEKYYNKKYNNENRDRLIVNKREYRKKYPEKTRAYSDANKDRIDQYYKDNKERIKNRVKKYYEENREEKLEYAIYYGKKNRKKISEYYKVWEQNQPLYKIGRSISSGINSSLKLQNLSKNRRHWEDLVGYTVQDLADHLESLFQPGMTWDNKGEWHLDHIIPKSFFIFSSVDDVEFKYCWSLDNLQPLWAKDNLSKNSRIMKKYLKSDCLKSIVTI